MTDINIAELQAMADAVDRYEDGTAMHTSGDETCVDDCAACQYEGAAGRVLPSLLDKLERYERALLLIAPWGDGYDGAIARKALNPTEENDG